MRTAFALILCVCLNGCAGVRQHWADGFGGLWRHSVRQVEKHGPEVAADTAGAVVDGAVDHAIYGDETPRERQERSNEEFFGH